MKKIACLFFLSCLSQVLWANIKEGTPSETTVKLRGTITNSQTGTPLVSATVYIPDLKKGAMSDENGHYKIKNIPRGKYLVEVRYTGFSTKTENIQINKDTHKDWELAPAIIEGDAVVITGISKATEIRQQPTHISVLNHLQLQHSAADNIIGKIAELPGVSTITTGPDVVKPVIRGLSHNRVVVIDNGIRQEGQQWGDEHGIEIDSYAPGSIEVFRGTSSLMYGSDALGGVINILPPEPASEDRIQANLIANYQTNNGLIGYHGDIKGNSDAFTWHAYGTRKKAHDYKDRYDGYVFNSKFNEVNFGAGVGLNKSWGYSHLSFSSYDLRLGIPEGERDHVTGKFLKDIALNDSITSETTATRKDFLSYLPYYPKQRVQHQKISLNNKIRIGDGSVNATFGYQINRRREYEEVLQPIEPGLFLQLNTFNYNIHYSIAEMVGWNTTLGISGMLQNNKNKGDEFLIPDYDLLQSGIYGITQKKFHRLSFTGGLRLDLRSLDSKALLEEGKWQFKAFNKNYTSLSGSAGLSYQAGENWLFKANIARGFRAPAIPELAANGVHEGTFRYEIGNTNLKPEYSTELDVGGAYRSEHVSASLYGYYTIISHYIYSAKLLAASGADSLRKTGAGSFEAFKYEQTTAHLYGTEATVDIHPHPLDWLHFKNTFSLVRGINAKGPDSIRNLPDIPAARLITELRVNFPKTGHTFQKIYLQLQLKNTFAQNKFLSAYRTETATPGYSLLDINAGTDIVNNHGKTLFSLYLSAENLTDVSYQDHLSRLKYLPVNQATGRRGIFNMGRNFSFKVVFPFHFKMHTTN